MDRQELEYSQKKKKRCEGERRRAKLITTSATSTLTLMKQIYKCQFQAAVFL